jgi:hypothetical protein
MLFFALGILVIGGFGLFGWLRPKRSTDAFEVAGASLLLGSFFVSVFLFAVAPFLRGPTLVATIALFALFLGISGAFRLRKSEWETLPGGRVFTMVLLPAILIVAWQAFARPFGGDGLFNFEFRARLAWETGGVVPVEFYADRSRVFLHPDYPRFVPLNQLWIYLCVGEPHQGLAKSLGVIWFVGAVCLMFSQLSRATRHPAPGFLVMGMMFVVPMFVFYPGGAVWVWGDFPVSAMAIAALLYLVEYRANRTGLACFVVALAALPWIKRDGLILGCVLLSVFAFDAFKRREWRALVAGAIPFLLVAVGWKAFVTRMGAPALADFMTPSPALFFEKIEELPRITTIAARELCLWQRWSLLWPIALLAWIRIAREPELARWRFAAGINAALIAIYASLYLFTAWPALAWHMVTSFPRLLLAPAMMATVLIAVAFPVNSRTRVDR